MELKNIKIVILMLFVLLAGSLYSCNNNKDSDIISLEDSSDNQVDSKQDDDLGQEESQINNADIDLEESSDKSELIIDKDKQETSTDNPKLIYVHISGAVNKPGVYGIADHTRLYELIDIAGGLASNAAGDYVNQAANLMDSQQVYIPTIEEVKESGVWQPPDTSNQEFLSSDKASSKVNINKASKEELMTLTGIGEAKATSIIQYRDKHGGFKRIEDIMNISGIKQAAFNKISEDITVD